MTSLAITIRTVDSVPSWPTPAPVVRKLGQPTFGRPRQVQSVRRVESRLIHFSTRRSGAIMRIQYRPRVAHRGEKSEATRVVSTFGA